MYKILRNITIIIIALLALIIAYYAVEIIKARAYTRAVITQIVQSKENVLDVQDLTARQLEILLAVEDPAFYRHDGMDLTTPGAGITTITQALVKIFYFTQFKPGIAKIKQTIIAVFALDPLISKDDQLRLFINHCYLGNVDGQAVIGFAAAAQAYYGKPFSELSEDEYISLVAMLIAPATFNIHRYPERNAERVARIKRVISGTYTPKGLFDLFYGKMPRDLHDKLPPFSYFEFYYDD